MEAISVIVLGVIIAWIVGLLWRIHSWTKTLYVLHMQKDGDGVPVWYVRKSMVSMIETNNKVLSDLHITLTHQTEVLERIEKSMQHENNRR